MGVVPTDDELIKIVRSVRAQNSGLGVQKLLAALLVAEPSWSVSEKRLRKVLQKLKNEEGSDARPTSSLNPALDVAKYTDKVRPVMFGPEKGKGLVAAQDIGAGEVLWREDPFVYAPPWEIYEAQIGGTACAHCARAFTPSTPPLRVKCPHSEQTTSSPHTCRATFCSRLCLTRAGSTHSLLCPVANPACDLLLDFLQKRRWKAAVAFTKCVVRILAAWQDDGSKNKGTKGAEEGYLDKDATLNTYQSFATLRSDKRWTHINENDLARAEFEKLYAAMQTALVQGLFLPPSTLDDSETSSRLKEIPLVERPPAHDKALKRLLKVPVPPAILISLFSREGVLEGLGKMSLNLESHGGLFPLHSHLNHSCAPNLSVRHIPTDPSAPLHSPNPSRITLITATPIKKDDEILVSYVDPNQDLRARRRALRDWDFGICKCGRCLGEEKDTKPGNVDESLAGVKGAKNESQDTGDLEDEIRGFLGV
ncbi:SET domain-containing protein 5 [Ceratobasidium sp. 394]|nr:SET domain-containing protein 5 [Ceratobasidium sp. 394]